MFSLSVAMDEKKGIGKNNVLPWHIREELQLFRSNTLGKHIVMGSRTYRNLPGKLKDRYITVVTSREMEDDDVEVCHDFPAFLKEHEKDETEYVICGGSSIYAQAYPYCSKAYVSFVKGDYETDCIFESFDLKDWIIQESRDYGQFCYCLLVRRQTDSIEQ